MPYVNIKITREGAAPGEPSATPAQKAALIKGVSELLLTVLNKPLAATFVVIDEVELEDWGVGGLPVEEYRRQATGEAVTAAKKK
jgi:4-oxalocrotonate tautomerase